MYKVILADDEVHILMLLRKLIDWESMGIDIIGEYTDGLETFEAICRQQPDIVITDIMMSGLSGLDIVQKCIQQKINSVFLLISGHAEFEYAHMAIQYGVENYLLKPIDQQELEHNLRHICARLNSERLANENKTDMENQILFNKEILNGQFLSNMLFKPGWLTLDSYSALLADYNLAHIDGFYQLLAIKAIPKTAFDDEQYRLLLKQISHYSVKSFRKVLPLVAGTFTDRKVYLLAAAENEARLNSAIRHFFDKLEGRFFEYCDVSVGVSQSATDIFSVSLAQAESALLNRFNNGMNRLYIFDPAPEKKLTLPLASLMADFSRAMDTANASGIKVFFNGLEQTIAGPDLDLPSYLSLLELMRNSLADALERFCHGTADISRIHDELEAMAEQAVSKLELARAYRDYICRELESYHEQKSNDKHRYIHVAKEYINAHLSENISLNDIANSVYMNPAYFSTLFKKVTGENLSDYLVMRRIQKSKELLKDLRLSISEVAERVGYKNARYFSKVFLKTLGLKPSEFRKMNLP